MQVEVKDLKEHKKSLSIEVPKEEVEKKETEASSAYPFINGHSANW